MKVKNSIEDLRERRKRLGNLGSLDFLISYIEADGDASKLSNHQVLLSSNTFPVGDMPLAHKVQRFKDTKTSGEKIRKDIFLQAHKMRSEGKKLALSDISILFSDDLETHPEAYLLAANSSLDAGDEISWLANLNRYLKIQDISPINLKENDELELFYRIKANPRRRISKGPKVSVIIPAFNAEKTIAHSISSILEQSWVNLEVIVIDDCSTDNTWSVLTRLAKTDNRLIVRKNSQNSGPYIAKNLALQIATGDFITGHDADDWSHPERIEMQLAYIKKYDCPVTLSYMLRVDESGRFTYLGRRTSFSPDGALRKALISTMFERRFFQKHIGSWDCVRFGADSEMFGRVQLALRNKKIPEAPFVSMLCLDLETNLTNHPQFGIDKITGVKGPRITYKEAWQNWHKTLKEDSVKLEIGTGRHFFEVPYEAFADINDAKLIADLKIYK